MVVHNQDFDPSSHGEINLSEISCRSDHNLEGAHLSLGIGIHTPIVVPASGLVLIRSSPFRMRTRSAMFFKPNPPVTPSAGACSCLNPRPSSLTQRQTCRTSRSNSTLTDRACACLIAFVRHS